MVWWHIVIVVVGWLVMTFIVLDYVMEGGRERGESFEYQQGMFIGIMISLCFLLLLLITYKVFFV